MYNKFFITFVWVICGVCMTQSISTSKLTEFSNHTRQAKWFPFYTIGRFQNTPCQGKNKLLGTCVLDGECNKSGGIPAGSCSSITRQAVCCIYQQTCAATISENNTYFVNPNYPDLWNGGSQTCLLRVEPNDGICQLRIELLDFSLAQPSGDGICNTDVLSISGSASNPPLLCGENAGQHIIADFIERNPITLTIKATAGYTFGRHWNIRLSQIACDSGQKAPSGCLQYYTRPNGIVRSFNYASSPNSKPSAVGVEGSRQIANLNYGICIEAESGSCSITYAPLSSDPYSFTLSGDVGAVDVSMLGNGLLQDQNCTTDFVIIGNPSQTGVPLASGIDRFCGLGLKPTTSNVKPFVLYAVTNGNEATDIGNRGFALAYAQNLCPVISK